MRFDCSEALANHVKKFCSDSSYANVDKLEQRLMELGNKQYVDNPNLNFQEVRQYLKGEGEGNQKQIGKMNLEDLRNHFQSENRKFEDIQKVAVRAKEGELIKELGDLKMEKNFLRQQRQEQQEAMHDLIKEVEMKKDRELRAKIEKEEIQKALKEIERTKTSALERDKRKELEKLAAEREHLRLREEEVVDDIKGLENKMYEQERAMKEDKDRKLNQVNGSEYYGQVMRRKEVEMAKNRGEEIAQLQLKKEQLEKDRHRIMDDLEKVKGGDLQSLRKNEASRWVANDIIRKGGMPSQSLDFARVKLDPQVKDKLVTDQARINNLKEQRDKMLRDALPEIDELDNFTKKWSQPQNKVFQGIPSHQPAAPQSHFNNYPSSPEQMMKSKQQPIMTAYPAGPDSDMLDKLRMLKEEYARNGEGDPEFFNQIDDLENHILGNKQANKQQVQDQQRPEPQHSTHIQYQNPQSMVPPMLPPPPHGMYPPPQFPVNFHPQQAPYQLPPPPQPNGGQYLERFQQEEIMEPPPYIAQPYLNPQIKGMNNLIKEQELQNEQLEKELIALKNGGGSHEQFEQLLGNSDQEINKLKMLLSKNKKQIKDSKQAFPEDFVFRQNEFRCEDLEVEERALMNITAQEFDALRLISKLPVNSELYRYKMDQYKELSTMRSEIEKVLQEQRLEKIRRDFEKQKYEDERRFKHEKWLEDQKRQILEAKLKNAARPPPQQIKPQTAQSLNQQIFDQIPGTQSTLSRQYSGFPQQQRQSEKTVHQSDHQEPPQLNQTRGSFFQDDQDPNKYDPSIGMNLYFDFVARLQRQFRSMRVVYAVYNVSRSIVNPSLIDIHDAEPDPEDQEKNRIMFKISHTLKNIQPHPSSNLIIELQVLKPNTGSSDKFVSYGWTVLNMFDVYYELNRGIFKLPLYVSPTKTDIDVRDMQSVKRIPETLLCMRIGNPDDVNTRFPLQFNSSPDEYVTPKIHQFEQESEKPIPSQGRVRSPPEEEETKFEQADIPIPASRMKTAYECKGINIQVHYVKQYMPPTHARIQCTLYEGSNIVKSDDNKPMNWITKPVDINNVVNTHGQNPINAGMAVNQNGLARGEILAVEDETNWIKDLYKLLWDHNKANNLMLVVQIMEYAKGRKFNSVHEIKTEYVAVAYGVLQLNNYDGTIKYGTYDLELFKPPINLLKRSQLDILKSRIKVTIAQPHFTAARPQTQANILGEKPVDPNPLSYQEQKPLQIEPPQQMQRQDSLPNQAEPQSSEKPFIPNQMKQFDEIRFADGEGIDLYIDGARFLPENVTYSRILMRAFTNDQFRVINATKGLADLEISKGRHPFYGFRQEIRAPKVDPTLTIMIQVETIDRSDGTDKIVGYGYFPLFLNQSNKRPCNDRNSSNVHLQTGAYQIPLYMSKLPIDKDITIENIQALEKILCASLLVRCYKAPVQDNRVLSIQEVDMQDWRSKGLIIDPPDYQDGVYNTTYSNVSQFEQALFDIKNLRVNPQMRQVVDYLQQLRGRIGSRNDPDILRWLDKQLVTNAQTENINYKYFSAYEPRFGFRFGLEKLHGINQKLPHIVITSITPAGQFYANPPRKTPDVNYFTEFNWDSPWNSISYSEEMLNYANLPANDKLAIIIDVKALKMTSQQQVQIIDVGWSYIPIFEELENENGIYSMFTNSGLHAIPLWSGPVQKELVQYASKSDNPYNLLRQDRSLKMLEFASVIMRIHDNQREWAPSKGFYGDLNNLYLPQEKLAKYVFNDQRDRTQFGQETAKFGIPAGMSKEAFKKKATEAINQKYGL